MTGGGKQKGYKSCYFRNQKVPAANYFEKLLKKLGIHSANKGSILIEFAICMPVLIILLYYVHDLSKLKRYYDQTEFVAQQMVNMIQNISQKRDNKRLTKSDFKDITSLAWLTMFPGNTRYSPKSLFGYSPGIALYYVKGLDNGNASCVWRVWSSYESLINHDSDLHWDVGTGGYSHLSVKYKTNSSPSFIHPSLKINPGEKKIILEVTFVTHPNWMNMSGKSSDKQKFKFYLLDPKVAAGDKNSFHTLLTSVVIFTPQTGLFDETPPQ